MEGGVPYTLINLAYTFDALNTVSTFYVKRIYGRDGLRHGLQVVLHPEALVVAHPKRPQVDGRQRSSRLCWERTSAEPYYSGRSIIASDGSRGTI